MENNDTNYIGEQFTFNNLTVNELSQRTKYRTRSQENKTSVHWGQRKLHLSEVEFFTIFWDPVKIPEPICVYAGAASGTHIELLSIMFPRILFHLYDPAPFTVKETDKIKIFNDYFTDETCLKYAGRNDVFFVCDIRTADYRSSQEKALLKRGFDNVDLEKMEARIKSNPLIKEAFDEAAVENNEQIKGDMEMQQNWVLLINPEHAYLKFRLLFSLDGKDRIQRYLKGTIFWQTWPPHTSAETRLKPVKNDNGVYELGDWSILEYEELCFNHNSIIREQSKYRNIFTGTDDPIDSPELLNDFDSVSEAFILKLYFEKFGMTDPNELYDNVKRLSRLTTWSINHYKDDNYTSSLSSLRESSVKSTNRHLVDAFRKKSRNQGKKPISSNFVSRNN